MPTKIGLIFATRNAIQPALDAFAQFAPDVETQLFVDEGLLPAVKQSGGVTAPILRRFASLLARAEESGVDGILFSCSVFSPSLAVLEPLYAVPLMSVDSAMIEEAAAKGGSIGVIATLEQARQLTVDQLAEQASRMGTDLAIHSAAVPDAFACLPADPAKHDAIVLAAAEKMAPQCDSFMLAQISMARAAPLVAKLGKPVLTSMESSVNAIMSKLQGA